MKLRFHGRMEGYNSERFRKDLIAGVIVGIVALPLAMAFAIAIRRTAGSRTLHGDRRRGGDFSFRRVPRSDWRPDRRDGCDPVRDRSSVRLE